MTSSVARALTVALVTVAGLARAHAHVAPSEDVDNRYLKLTPMGDRVRVAYTIYLGQKPGAALRRRLDADRDGQLADAEARTYGDAIAARVRPALTVTLDGRPATIAWTTIDVGLGTPAVDAGAFSVDLIGWLCTGGGPHQLVLHDRFVLERPGESEVRLEESPGVTLGARRLGGDRMDGLDARWTGADGPLAAGGLELAWTSSAEAVRPRDGRCAAAATTAGARRWPLYAAGAALLLIGLGAGLARVRRRPRT